MNAKNYIGWYVIVKGAIPKGVPIKVTEQTQLRLWSGIRYDNGKPVIFGADKDGDISERFSEETHPERFL